MGQKPEQEPKQQKPRVRIIACGPDGCRYHYNDGTIVLSPKDGGPNQTYRWYEEKPGMPVLQDFVRAIAEAIPIGPPMAAEDLAEFREQQRKKAQAILGDTAPEE